MAHDNSVTTITIVVSDVVLLLPQSAPASSSAQVSVPLIPPLPIEPSSVPTNLHMGPTTSIFSPLFRC